MKGKSLTLGMSTFACLVTLQGVAVGIVEQGETWTVTNMHYAATFDGGRGGVLTGLSYGGKTFRVTGEFVCGSDKQDPIYNKRAHAAPQEFPQQSQKIRREDVEQLANGALAVRLSWETAMGIAVSQKCVFDESPIIRFGVRLSWKSPVAWAYYRLLSAEVDPSKCVFQPENRRFPGVNNAAARSCLPQWKYLNDGERAYGLVMLPQGDWDHFRFHSQGGAVGWSQMTDLELRHGYLANAAAPGETEMAFALIATADAALAAKAVRDVLPDAPAVQLTDLEPEGTFAKKGGENGLVTTLVNNTEASQTVRLVSDYSWGLDKTVPVKDEQVTLAPFEHRPYRTHWTYPEEVEWGVTARLAVYDLAGRLLDRRADVTSVTDFAPAAVGVTCLNATMCCQDGFESAWAEREKRMYIGLIEYYAWTPATWDLDRKRGLSPVADSWHPVSECTAIDRPVLTKKFVKGFVDSCHRNGIHVYAWVTLLTDYQNALVHPEYFQYCANGQLCIYNGEVNERDRIAIAKLDPYNAETSRDWGDQMADSVDMFGWDGCRFDSGFVPHTPNDPLYHSLVGDASADLEAYNWQGIPQSKLYPNVDKTGYEALNAWRSSVGKRHPNFVFGANVYAAKDVRPFAALHEGVVQPVVRSFRVSAERRDKISDVSCLGGRDRCDSRQDAHLRFAERDRPSGFSLRGFGERAVGQVRLRFFGKQVVWRSARIPLLGGASKRDAAFHSLFRVFLFARIEADGGGSPCKRGRC